MRQVILAGMLALGLAGTGLAQEVTLAQSGLAARIDALKADAGANRFELGMLQSLRAVEKTLQTRYRYGVGDSLSRLPLLRLQFGSENPLVLAGGPDVLSGMMRTVLTDLEEARATLEQATENGEVAAFELTLQDIWFDIDINGQRDSGEDVVRTLAPLLLGRNSTQKFDSYTPLTVRFDAADHAWLMAYTHMLSGVGSLFLAFDPAPVIRQLEAERAMVGDAPSIPNIYDDREINAAIQRLEKERESLQAKLKVEQDIGKEMRTKLRELRDAKPLDKNAVDALRDKQRQHRTDKLRPLSAQMRFIRTEINAEKAKLSGNEASRELQRYLPQIDVIWLFIASLRQSPDAAHITAARDHWLQMIVHNKAFWAALALETDDDREWIPSSRQTSALGVSVDDDLARAWQGVLADAEAVLEGELLLPHPLMPDGAGISVKAYAENPSGIDIIDWVHGIGAYRYAAKGPMITQQRWIAFQRLTAGNAGGFALFFN